MSLIYSVTSINVTSSDDVLVTNMEIRQIISAIMYELSGFQRDMIYCIAALDEPYGLEIGRELEEYSSTEVNHGRLYPNLNQLVDEGLLRKEQKDDRTNLYTLTPLGKELIVERRQWEDDKLQATDLDLD